MRIPITMCHGISDKLSRDHFAALAGIVAELGFDSINYDDLAAWRAGAAELPPRPIMIDFDHPRVSMLTCRDILAAHGLRGNLFVHTKPLEDLYAEGAFPADRDTMTWDEIRELIDAGWHIGAHTHSHPNLSALSLEDPSGERLREELTKNDDMLRTNLGIDPRDFAFTGTSWSSAAEAAVKERYRFGRLWIVGNVYNADGQEVRYADMAGVPGDDEPDGGPPAAARYATKTTDPYRLPSMEIERLIFEPDAFRAYLEGALTG